MAASSRDHFFPTWAQLSLRCNMHERRRSRCQCELAGHSRQGGVAFSVAFGQNSESHSKLDDVAADEVQSLVMSDVDAGRISRRASTVLVPMVKSL